ncbi:MAG: glycosyltransferase family 4 protein [Clostridiales bacterium]|nr:glycosyltransferase family 4 protein [Clostridiales bacterium]
MNICFLSLNSYPLLTNSNLGYAGGAEVEQVILGKQLNKLGHKVSFITYKHSKNKIENKDGIQIISTYSREKAQEIDFIQKYKLIFSALKRTGADLYFHEAGSTGILPLFCSLHKKKFIHRIASDATVLSKSLAGNYSFKNNLFDIIEMKSADAVISQSKFQQKILFERFKIQSILIKNGLLLPKVISNEHVPSKILWIGSLSLIKNPIIFLELAKAIPQAKFEMIGGRGYPPYLFDKIEIEAKKVANLKFHGFIPHTMVNNYFRDASIFVNTSTTEGFPNTFIEAWGHKIPIVSLNIDPDKVIQNKKLGYKSGTFKKLVSDVTALIENEKLRRTMGENARSYVEKEHDIKQIAKMYMHVFEKVISNQKKEKPNNKSFMRRNE